MCHTFTFVIIKAIFLIFFLKAFFPLTTKKNSQQTGLKDLACIYSCESKLTV